MAIYNRKIETMSRAELTQVQLERLQMTLNRVQRNVAFYRALFEDRRVDIQAMRSLADLTRLPFTTKDDVGRSAPYDLFAVPLRDIVRIHSTAGTTREPVGVGYTVNDIRHWSGLVARVLVAAGVTEHDFVQIAFPYGLMTGGLGFHYGAERLGASVIPASGEDVHRQIAIMKNFKTTVLIGRPGYALAIADALAELKLPPQSLHLRCGLLGSEPCSENQRRQIEDKLQIRTFDNYGLSEIIGPGVAFECEAHQGLHINEDHFLAEVVHPEIHNVLPAGEEGELVFTTLTKEGFPLIRYRTGDIGRLLPEPCPCGRTLIRMSRVKGRTDDLLFFEGHKFFPSQVENILLREKGVSPHFSIILDRKAGVDSLEVQVGVMDNMPSFDEVKGLEKLRGTLEQALATELKLRAKVLFVQPIASADAGKKKRIPVIDRRT